MFRRKPNPEERDYTVQEEIVYKDVYGVIEEAMLCRKRPGGAGTSAGDDALEEETAQSTKRPSEGTNGATNFETVPCKDRCSYR